MIDVYIINKLCDTYPFLSTILWIENSFQVFFQNFKEHIVNIIRDTPHSIILSFEIILCLLHHVSLIMLAAAPF